MVSTTSKYQFCSLSEDQSALIGLVESTFREPKILDISRDLDQIALVFMSFKDWGSKPLASCDMSFLREDPDELLNKIGIFLMTLVGDGRSYHEGLYGPLPFFSYGSSRHKSGQTS